LRRNGIRLRVVGDLSRFEPTLQEMIHAAQRDTAANRRMTLTIAANYGGRWDILQATSALMRARAAAGADRNAPVTESELAQYVAVSCAPGPDLSIRTGGAQRISNFLLWPLAYPELYFCDAYWPDFDTQALQEAIAWYGRRERRFGRTGGQLAAAAG